MYTLSDSRYNEIIDDTLVDTYDESEEVGSFSVMLQENVELPLSVSIVGYDAKITDFVCDNSRVIALVSNDSGDYRVDLRDVDIAESVDTEWIVAYKKWRSDW
jgi:hypothetical protein